MAAAKDRRLFVKLTLDFTDHPKIAVLSPEAFHTLVDALIYSRRMLTDGFLANRLALARWSLENLQELCANDAEKPSLIEREDGWYITDYAEHQDTKADVEARQRQAKLAGQLGGLARAKRTAKRNAKRNVSEPLSKQRSGIQAEEEGNYYVVTNGAARSNGAATHKQKSPTETFEEALARAEREAEEIF